MAEAEHDSLSGERYMLEQHPRAVAAFIKSDAARVLPIDNLLVASLALEPRTSAAHVAKLLA